MKDSFLSLFSTCQELENNLAKEEIVKIQNIQKLYELLQKITQEYIKIREYIYFILKNQFKNSIIYSRQIDEKILNLDHLFIEFSTSTEVLLSNIQEIKKTITPHQEKLLNFQLQLLNQQINKVTSLTSLLKSIILDIIEIIQEFEHEKSETININEQNT